MSMLKTGDIARKLGVSNQTIINWCNLPPNKSPLKYSRITKTGPRWIKPKDLESFLHHNDFEDVAIFDWLDKLINGQSDIELREQIKEKIATNVQGLKNVITCGKSNGMTSIINNNQKLDNLTHSANELLSTLRDLNLC